MLKETNVNLKKIKDNPNKESLVDDLFHKFLPLVFKNDGYECSSQFYDIQRNRFDLQIHYKNGKGEDITILIVEDKSEKGEGYYDMLPQAPKYSDNDVLNRNTYKMTAKGTLVSFYVYIQYFHSSNKFSLKGGGVDGLLGVYFDWESMSIKIVPQINTFIAQAVLYDFAKTNTCINVKYSLLAILNFISTQSISPRLEKKSICDSFKHVEEGTLDIKNKNKY